jgi:hypothetical protein
MKKIIITCGLLALTVSGAQAQSRTGSKASGVSTTTTTVVHQDGSAATVSTPGHSDTKDVKIQSNSGRNDYPVNNGGIIVDDHAYQPAGTAPVGVYGNGMGGSTIGSSPANGGTGVSTTTTVETTNGKNTTKSKTSTR